MKLRRVGRRGLLAEVESLEAARALHAEALRLQGDGSLDPAMEVVPGALSVLFDGVDDASALASSLRSITAAGHAPPARRQVEIPVRYDGPDLDDVAARWGVATSRVGAVHADLQHVVAFLGFAPGFAYIAGLAGALRVPRLDSPRPSVPAGSVGLADGYTGIYPRSSPGGWRLIGTTDATLFDLARTPPALLSPGDAVRFVPVGP